MLTIAQHQVYEEGIVSTTIDLIEGLVRDGSIPEDRIEESYRRITAFKAALSA